MLLWVAVAAATIAAGIGAATLADSRPFLLVLAVAAVAGVAIVSLVVLHRRGGDALSPLGLVALFYLATFAFGGVYFYVTPLPGRGQPYESHNIVEAVGLAALSLPLFVLGYALHPLRTVLRVLPPLPSNLRRSRSMFMLLVLLVTGWAARLYMIDTGRYFYSDVGRGVATGSSWLMGILATLPLVATAYVGATYYLALRAGSYAPRDRWLYFALVIVELAYNAPTGSRAGILTVIMTVVVIGYYGSQKRPSVIGITALLAVVVLVIFPFFFAYRNAGAGTPFQQDLGGNLRSSASSLFDQSPKTVWDSGVTSTLQRFSGVAMIASLLNQGPDAIPREPGETLSWSYTGLLPRALAPNKPDPGAFAHEFGDALGVTAPGDTRTSVTVTPLGELYFNYRLTGVLVGMFLLGAMYRVIGAFFESRQRDAVTLAIYAALSWPLINAQEAIIAGGLVGIIKAMAVLVVVLITAARLSGVPTLSAGARHSARARVHA